MHMDEITLFLSILITGVASLLFIVSIIRAIKLRNLKFSIISTAFLIFAIKGLLLFFEFLAHEKFSMILDLAVIVLLYFAIIKR